MTDETPHKTFTKNLNSTAFEQVTRNIFENAYLIYAALASLIDVCIFHNRVLIHVILDCKLTWMIMELTGKVLFQQK